MEARWRWAGGKEVFTTSVQSAQGRPKNEWMNNDEISSNIS